MCSGCSSDQRDRLEAVDESPTVRFVVDVLQMEDLEARRLHLRNAHVRSPVMSQADRMSEQPALRIGEHVDLDLPHAALGELYGQRRMFVGERAAIALLKSASA